MATIKPEALSRVPYNRALVEKMEAGEGNYNKKALIDKDAERVDTIPFEILRGVIETLVNLVARGKAVGTLPLFITPLDYIRIALVEKIRKDRLADNSLQGTLPDNIKLTEWRIILGSKRARAYIDSLEEEQKRREHEELNPVSSSNKAIMDEIELNLPPNPLELADIRSGLQSISAEAISPTIEKKVFNINDFVLDLASQDAVVDLDDLKKGL